MRRRVDRSVVLAAVVLIFYFALNQGCHAAWIPALAGVWICGMRADLVSTFRHAGMLKYESNRLLVGCVRRYGARRAVPVSIACEAGFILMVSTLLSRPVGFDVADFMFMAGVVGVCHMCCAKSNDDFQPA